MNRYAASVRIAAKPDRIWPVIADVTRWPDWLPTMTAVEHLDEAALRMGHRYRLLQPGFRPTLWSVVELEPQKAFAWEARWPGARALARHAVRPVTAESSEVLLQVVFSGPLGLLAGALAGRRIRRYLALEVASLKQKMEQRA
ncbi:MAG: SRPBCC family protein [Hydrogenophaga sp.]|nr:SRPBCC family protein [Hydrogenophaga sp.]